ncbi:ABC transporter substrate-binding protein, partial [Actinosynnema sp. NPDC023658]|uniref:ABC transporter substrate-binding protein n=1 Tax=Actinosynnema sp. NPDC023658 TaxID=3155465 RepID=UPI0033DC3A41
VVAHPRTRRAWLAVPLLALSAACTGEVPDQQAGGEPVDGGTLTFAVDREPNCLDPHVSPAEATALIGRGVFDSLVAQDPAGGFHPWLARSWQVSADLRTYTFDLRDDVRFHDGTPLDAAAVKASFDRIADPATKSLYAATLLGPYEGTTVVDADTAEVRFTKPFAPFLQAASTTYLGIASPKALTGFAGSLCDHLVGSGPFTYERHVAQQEVALRRNPDHAWAAEGQRAGPARLERLVFRFVPESTTRLGGLTSGQVDAAAAIPAESVAGVRDDPALEFHSTPVQGAAETLYLNTSRAPFDDVRVRTAVQRGIDVDGLVRSVYFGQRERAWSILSPSTPYYDRGTEGTWGHDRALAERLLDESGWTGRDAEGYRTKAGARLVARWPYTELQASTERRGTLAQAIQAQAKELGIDVQRPVVQAGDLYRMVALGVYELTDTSWTRADPDVLRAFLTSGQAPPAGQNYSRVRDPELDSWLGEAAATGDEGTRRSLYARAQQRAVRDALAVPLYVPVQAVGTARPVSGLAFDPAG